MLRIAPNGAAFQTPGPARHTSGVRDRFASSARHWAHSDPSMPGPIRARLKPFGEPMMLRSLNDRGYRQASEWWSWVKSTDMLFTADKKQLSAELKKRLQPIFDSLGLGVDLSRIYIQVPYLKNDTVGYRIRLRGRPEGSPFYETLGALLHELGHVVQEVNMPYHEWSRRRWYMHKTKKDLIERTEWEARIATVWDMDYRDRSWAEDAYHNDEERYRQDPFLKSMPLEALAQTRLLGPYPLDAQCNRFADLLLSLPGKQGE